MFMRFTAIVAISSSLFSNSKENFIQSISYSFVYIQVNYLESRLQEAMRGESGRNALIKQVAKLEGEVKHLRERLDMRQAEALVGRTVVAVKTWSV